MKVMNSSKYRYVGTKAEFHMFENTKYGDLIMVHEAKVIYPGGRVVFFKPNGVIEQGYSSNKKFHDWAKFYHEMLIKPVIVSDLTDS